MIVLSIDVGMKHLAHCLLKVDRILEVLDWDVVDLTGSEKCFKCVKTATVKGAFGSACAKHKPVFKTTGMKKDAMESLCVQYGIHVGNREDMAKRLAEYKKTTPYASTPVSRGRELCAAYARFDEHAIDLVLIENQMAAKMAVVQGMLTQYWIQKGVKTIEAVSPVHKLKGLPKSSTATYAQRKKAGVERTREVLKRFDLNVNPFDSHKKKDDLADTFLQALWYLEKNGVLDPTVVG